jgi:hypothetical protein
VVSAKTEVTKTETETTAVCRAGEKILFSGVKKSVFFFLDVYFRDGNLFSWKRTADLTSL